MKQLFTLFLLFSCSSLSAQVFWNEDFNDGAATTRWVTENAPGSKTNPTPAGISSLTYSTNDACNNYWIINDFNTPENNPAGVMGIGVNGNYSTRFVRGRNYNCLTPNDLPNPDPGGGTINKSLHVTFKPCSDSYSFGLNNGPADGADEYSILNSEGPSSPGASNSEQYAFLNQDINTVGKCNIYLEAQMFLGGDQAGNISYGTVLYSINSGATWKILQDNIVPSFFFIAGTCNNWEDKQFLLPAECEGITTLRLAFRWRNDGNQPPINTTGDYTLMAGFNVDNIVLKTVGPTADFNFGSIGSLVLNSWNACKMSDVLGINNASSGTGITGYFWDIPGATFTNGTSATDFEPDFYYDNAQTFGLKNVTLNVIYGTCTTSITRTITLQPCTPFVDFIAKYTTLCSTNPLPLLGSISIDTLINLTNSPGNRNPVNYTWTITGPGTVTYVNSTNVNSVNPQVTFDVVGQYTVQLVATNLDGAGSNSPLIKTSYINVVNCQCGSSAVASTPIVNYDFDGTFLGWTSQVVGAEGARPNFWCSGDGETWQSPSSCGTGSAGDPTLHIVNEAFTFLGIPLPDGCSSMGGARYNASGAAVVTNRRIFSPNISTLGYTNIIVQFDFIGNGQALTDRAFFEYSTDGGTIWNQPTNVFSSSTPANGGNLNNLKSLTGCMPQGQWQRITWNMPIACENIANLKVGFRWVNNNSGGSDPSFAVDKVIILGSLPPAPPSVWLGNTADWNTTTNWSTGAVPTATTNISIPDPATLGVGKFMPAITSNAVALNVCNSGTITIGNGATNVNLTIGGFLNNFGAITSTNSNTAADVIFNGTGNVYRGGGLNHDVDYQAGTAVGNQLTLESNLSCRSFNLANGTLVASNNTLTLKKDFTIAAGTTLTTNVNTSFVVDGPNAANWTNPYSNPINQVVTTQDVTTNQNITIGLNTTFPNIYVRKQNNANIVTLASAFNYTVSNLLQIESGTLDANTQVLNGAGNVNMSGGQLRTSRTGVTLPQITGTYTLTAGTIDFYGAGNQTVRQLPAGASTAYYNMIFQGSGTKSFIAGTTTCNNSVSIAGTAIVDVSTNTFNGNASLTMAATACSLRVAKVSGSPTLPELTGNYSLSNPSVIEIQNTTAGTQTQYVRVPTGGNYANLVFTNTSATSIALRYLTGNTTVSNSVVISNASGANNVVDASTYTFDGNASLTMSNFSNLRLAKTGVSLPEFTGTITYNDGTNILNSPGVEFYGNGNQTFKTNTGYRNMLFSNNGTKTMQSGNTTCTRSVNITGGLVVVAGGTDQFMGGAELRMSGGDFQIATLQSTAALIPQFTNTYTLNGGRVTINGLGTQTLRSSVSAPSANYNDLNFAGTDVKSLSGNTNVFGRLYLNLPISAGNYVDALTTGSVLNVSNGSMAAVYRTGGHVVGDLRRAILSAGFPLKYYYPVGSDGLSGTVTYYEPLIFTLNGVLTGTASITSSFSKAAPVVSWTPPLVESGINYTALETEGFWVLDPNAAPSSSIDYNLEVTPSSGWVYTYSNKALAKRTPAGISPTDEWNWHGSAKISEFSRQNYASFSEFAIVTGDNVLPVETSPLTASAMSNFIQVNWISYSEMNHKAYILERSENVDFKDFISVQTFQNMTGNNSGKSYQYSDYQVEREKTYFYRYRQMDIDGKENFSNIASAKLSDFSQQVIVYPNPSQGLVNLKMIGFEEEVQLVIYDVLGKKVYEQTIQPTEKIVQIPSQQWSDGVYAYQLIGKQSFKGNFVIQK